MMTMSIFILRVYRCCLIILAVTSLGFLQACSAVRLAYNQVPEVGYWWLDGYIDLNSQQSPRVRDELARLLAWHRTNELPKYTATLQKAQDLLPNAVTAQQVCAVYDELRAHVDTAINKALPTMADMALTLSTEQIEHLRAKYKKNNDEYVREYLKGSEQDRAGRRLKQAISRSESVYGSLDEAQIAAIKLALKRSSVDAAMFQKERERRQKEALELLSSLVATQPSPAATQTQLRSYFNRSFTSPDPVYRAYAAKTTQQSCEFFAIVHATTTPAQRAKAVQTLQGYTADLQVLSAQK